MLLLKKRLLSELDNRGWSRCFAIYECSYCGKQEKKVVVNKKIDSCGCNIRNLRTINATKHGESKGNSKTRLYGIWLNMRNRCNNSKLPEYKYYGEKGVKVCLDWNSYTNFKNWALTNGYLESLTIDRIDSSKNYSPNNCQWITRKENSMKAGLSTAFKTRKLNFNDAKKIRSLYKFGLFSQDKMSKLYNVSQETIYRIVNNYSYKLPVKGKV